jgi:hypothetical protein
MESKKTAQMAPCAKEKQKESTTGELELPTYSEDGVDLTLIRWMLSLSPVERLRAAQRYANSAQRLRNALRRV